MVICFTSNFCLFRLSVVNLFDFLFILFSVNFVSGKPRLFLIQSCRGKQKQKKVGVSNTFNQTSEHDECPGYSQSRSETSGSLDDDYYTDGSTDIPKLPIDADIIVAFATTPGYLSSFYI